MLVLLILLMGWAGFRTAFWEAPFVVEQPPFAQSLAKIGKQPLAPDAGAVLSPPRQLAIIAGSEIMPGLLAMKASRATLSWLSAPLAGRDAVAITRPDHIGPVMMPGVASLTSPSHDVPASSPVPAAGETLQAAPFRVSTPTRANRWSGDSWLLLRKDTTTAVTAGRGSYGQSQVGAVLRYRILPGSGHRPAAYVRASKALAGAGEAEAAIGVSARPVPSVPVTLAAEMRVMQASGHNYVRPAVYAVTELPRVKLPLGLEGEAYAQAGYVGGEYSTAFVDGQMRVERSIVEVGPVELSAGAGAWGGAQERAERLDIGPAATVAVDLGDASARLSLDWRFRVAGDAEPSDGPALTISAGF